MLSRPQIIDAVRPLGLPPGSYALFGGTVLAMHGLRDTNDIDILCTRETFERFAGDGWAVETKNGVPFCRKGDVELCADMRRGDFQKANEDVLADADVIDGVACVTLADTRAFKAALGREKDHADIALIDAFTASSRP